MYAVIVTGGKQYKVAEGEFLKVEKLDVETGASIEFDLAIVKTGMLFISGRGFYSTAYH